LGIGHSPSHKLFASKAPHSEIRDIADEPSKTGQWKACLNGGAERCLIADDADHPGRSRITDLQATSLRSHSGLWRLEPGGNRGDAWNEPVHDDDHSWGLWESTTKRVWPPNARPDRGDLSVHHPGNRAMGAGKRVSIGGSGTFCTRSRAILAFAGARRYGLPLPAGEPGKCSGHNGHRWAVGEPFPLEPGVDRWLTNGVSHQIH
jgi:hypothetical protein